MFKNFAKNGTHFLQNFCESLKVLWLSHKNWGKLHFFNFFCETLKVLWLTAKNSRTYPFLKQLFYCILHKKLGYELTFDLTPQEVS